MNTTSEREFIEGQCRNDQDKVRSHMYEIISRTIMNTDGTIQMDQTYIPMCGYGWNRSNGHRFSIFRGHTSSRGTCKLCLRAIEDNKPGVIDGWEHKTRWL